MQSQMKAAAIGRPFSQVLISAVTCGYVPILWPDPWMWGVTLGMGLVGGAAYARSPNYWGVMLSHAILGAVAITVGLT